MPSNGLQEVDFLHPKLSKVIEDHRGLLLADLSFSASPKKKRWIFESGEYHVDIMGLSWDYHGIIM